MAAHQGPADAAPPPDGGGASGDGGAADGAHGGGSRRKPFLLRLPPDLMDELRAWSGQELRSLNAHLEFLLREAVRERRRATRKKGTSP